MSEYQPFIPQDPRVRLVPARPRVAPRTWSGPSQELIDAGTSTWRVTGVAGSDVSSLVIDTVVERIRQGWDPSSILIVAASKEPLPDAATNPEDPRLN